MCGIAGRVGRGLIQDSRRAFTDALAHRGPDDRGDYRSPDDLAALAHTRLAILDPTSAGRQPMASPDGRHHLVLNGEIYNYLELRRELSSEHTFRTGTDTEVLLAAYRHWGLGCLERLVGMFAFLIWDERDRTLVAARDRFGVKPLYYHSPGPGRLLLASEIKALHAAGAPREPDPATWGSYLALGLTDSGERTFWQGIHALPAGCWLRLTGERLEIRRWYDLAERVGEAYDGRPEEEVKARYRDLLRRSVELRFRSDVPLAVNLSGGLDSSALLGLVHEIQGEGSDLRVYTFTCGDERYDELPWVQQMLEKTHHPLRVCRLEAERVPELAADVQHFQDEPFGGLPTLAYAGLFETARRDGVPVLLDGQGMDEQWAGYDYYASALENGPTKGEPAALQGTRESPVRPEAVDGELRALARPLDTPRPFPDRLRNLQWRDLLLTKLPRALRFNDRISMRVGVELREPFLDHRLVELALSQAPERKIRQGVHKRLLREMTVELAPKRLVEAPKRPLQTPQREWLRGPLRPWAEAMMESATGARSPGWLGAKAVRREWRRFLAGESDNSFYVWQWISLGLLVEGGSPWDAATGQASSA